MAANFAHPFDIRLQAIVHGRSMMRRLALTSVALVVLAGCGGGDAEPASEAPVATDEQTTEAEAPTVYDESQIGKHLGLLEDDQGLFYQTDEVDCSIAVIMTSASMVDMYVEAGDAVATNPEGTAGVKIVTPETATCLTVLNAALADL